MTKRKSVLVVVAAVCLLLLLALFCGFTTEHATVHTAYAAEAVEAENDAPTETTADETENHTFLGRVWEWIDAHKVEITAIIADIGMFIMLIYNTVKSKKSLLNVAKETAHISTSQTESIDGLNSLINAYNDIAERVSKCEITESERYKSVVAMVVQTRAVLDILTTVYANSKNLPQGVKDLVNLKYADALKLIGNDEKFIESVDAEKDDGETQSAEE